MREITNRNAVARSCTSSASLGPCVPCGWLPCRVSCSLFHLSRRQSIRDVRSSVRAFVRLPEKWLERRAHEWQKGRTLEMAAKRWPALKGPKMVVRKLSWFAPVPASRERNDSTCLAQASVERVIDSLGESAPLSGRRCLHRVFQGAEQPRFYLLASEMKNDLALNFFLCQLRPRRAK